MMPVLTEPAEDDEWILTDLRMELPHPTRAGEQTWAPISETTTGSASESQLPRSGFVQTSGKSWH